MTKKKLLFLVPYPLHAAPSQRFRVEQFLPMLEQQGITFNLQPFLDRKGWEVLYKKGSHLAKAVSVIKGFMRRSWLVCFGLAQYDYVFVHREAAPLGPPVFEWLIAKLWRKKMLYDFDDAIWIPTSSSALVNAVKSFWKIRYICKWSFKVVGGNDFLCTYARSFNSNVVLIPTCVDTVHQHNRLKNQNAEKLTVGWTGSHSTLVYLDPLVPVLKRLVEEEGIEVLVICNKKPSFEFPGLSFLRWKEETEVEDLMHINIGIMPLTKDKWSEGKCGFKLIQYLALGMPAVASPVGVNSQIVEQGQNGFLCADPEAWYVALRQLIGDASLRARMGAAGRQKVVALYSVQANAGTFLALFR